MQNKIVLKKEIRNIFHICCSYNISNNLSFEISKNEITFNGSFIRLEDETINVFLNSYDGIKSLYRDKKINVKFCYEDKKYEFNSECKGIDLENQRVNISIPSIIFSGERRQHVRYKPEDKIKCRIKYNEKVSFNGIIEDISEGGLCFTSQLNNADVMKKGLKLYISFILKNNVRRFLIEICYFSNSKCGCKFVQKGEKYD